MWIPDSTYFPAWLRSLISPPKKEVSKISRSTPLTNKTPRVIVTRMNTETTKSIDADVLPIVWLYDESGINRAHTFQHPHVDEDV